MKTLKRKTRSDKFPLTLHSTGQYCKKIKGKMYYFGSDKKEAIQRYFLENGKKLINVEVQIPAPNPFGHITIYY